jgi:hypothetical protein
MGTIGHPYHWQSTVVAKGGLLRDSLGMGLVPNWFPRSFSVL